MSEYRDCESRDACDDARAERDELKAENERLLAALKPFAESWRMAEATIKEMKWDFHPDDAIDTDVHADLVMTFKDFMQAAAALGDQQTVDKS